MKIASEGACTEVASESGARGSYARTMSVVARELLPFAEQTFVRDLEGLYEPWAAARLRPSYSC